MLNNRLEDLIYQYKTYRKRKFMQKITSIFILSIVGFSLYFIYDKLKTFQNETPKISNTKKIKEKTLPKKVEIKPTIVKVEKPKPKPLNEERILDKNTYSTLIMIEKKKPTYQSAYDLAEYYFKNKDYKLASKWAVVASNRDAKHDKAWLLYAKSKIKLNQKGIAKKALKIYLLKYHSREVSNLLNSL